MAIAASLAAGSMAGCVRPTPAAAQASSFVHESWTVEDGLPVNAINRVLQASDGYLWLATWDGLVRFDGVRFTTFNAGNSPGLPSSRIIELLEDRDGRLWMITAQYHLVRLQDGTFTHFDEARGLVNGSTRVMHVDPRGQLWIGTERGVFRLEGELMTPFAQHAVQGSVESLHRDAGGDLWVGTRRDGLYHVRDERVTRFSEQNGLASGWVSVLAEDSAGAVWIGTNAGVHRYGDGRLSPPLEMGGRPLRAHIREIEPFSSGDSAWVAAEEGIYVAGSGALRAVLETPREVSLPWIRFDPQGTTWFSVGDRLYLDGRFVFQVPLRVPGEVRPVAQIQRFAWDHEGSVWIATYNSGLYRLKPALFTVYSNEEGLAYRNITTVMEDRSGALWFGTHGYGLSRLSDGVVTNYTPDDGFSPFILSLMQDDKENLWVGTLRLGIQHCTLPGPVCGPPPFGDPDPEASVHALHQDDSGAIWAGTDRGLFRILDGRWARMAVEALPTSSVVRVFLRGADGTLWMGTSGSGVLAYRNGRFHRVTEAEGLPSDVIRSLYEDENGRIWVGTEGRGLVRVAVSSNSSDARWAVSTSPPIAQRVGLFDDVIHQILSDDSGRLWMSTNRGIFWVSFSELDAFADGYVNRIHSTSYTERDGLRNREANGGHHPAGIRARDGRLWFPTQDGAVVVDPTLAIRNPAVPPVVIERVVSEEYVWRPGAGSVVLDPSQRSFEIEYAALSFLAPENVRFRYRLEGLHDSWTEAGNRRTAFYTHVPPGEYVFRVIGSNNDGVWNEEGATVTLVVMPYFYESRAFYFLLFLAAVAFVIAAIRIRERRLKARARKLAQLVDERTVELELQADRLQELDRAKTSFFQNVSHELRTPLTLTIGPLEDLREQLSADGTAVTPGLEMALRNARRLLKLVNQILDVARLEAGHFSLHKRRIDLAGFVRSIAAEFAPVAARRGIVLDLTAPSEVIEVHSDPDAIEKVITNLLGNAFKFTPEGGRIHVLVEPAQHGAEDAVRVTVADTGPGIPESDLPRVFERFYQGDTSSPRLATGTGIGLALSRELVELHGGSIEAANYPGAGAVFSITLPLRLDEAPDAVPSDEKFGSGLARIDELELEIPAIELPSSASHPDEADVMTLLVVDDSAELRRWIRSVFERRFRVVEAADGREGLEQAHRYLPDIILSDVMMPRMDGRAMVDALRSSPETDFIPVVLLTAQASREQKLAGLGDGADDYVVKPFDVRELEARVDNLIASRRRLRDRFAGRRVDITPRADEFSAADREFIERVRTAIDEHFDDPSFGVAELAHAAFQDRSHLFRRTRELLGEAPSDLIRRLRLEHAARLLSDESYTVADVAYASGFRSVSYFCQTFRRTYEVSPSEYRGRVRMSV